SQAEKTGDVETVTTSIDTRGRQQPAKKAPPPSPVDRNDIGPNSTTEADRLRVQVDELQAELRQRDIKISGLENERREPINGARAIMASRKEPKDSLDPFWTPPWATRALVERVLPVLGIAPSDLAGMSAWEHACGEGHMAEPLAEYFGRVIASDVHNYG